MPTSKHRVLFVCIHNSARSQMAEAFLGKYGNDAFEVESAGLEPGTMNPNVVTVMQEVGIDLSKKITQGVFDLYKRGAAYNVVITVCDGASAEKCPVFAGGGKRIAWSFEDPSSFKGNREEVLQHTREVRDEIEQKVLKFIKEASSVNYWN
ncbi:MAG TPA: arsenate reductase ArsC [Puia sp.]|jgi:arsenate reductase|nr:arsenate reductase ArsC [Puia sp.]